MALIANLYAPRILLGEDPLNAEKIVARMEKAVKNNNQSRAVVDYALYDIKGKKLGVPVYKLLGGKSVDKITLGHIVGTGTPAETTAEAQKIVKAGELKHLIEIIEKDAADGLFIKVAKAGGILKARKWVSIAKAAGLPVMCGCMTGSGFESGAQAHFLISDEWTSQFVQENTGPLTIYNILDTVSVDIKDDLARKLPRYERGFMWAPEGPGLGLELNEEVVSQMITAGKTPVAIQ